MKALSFRRSLIRKRVFHTLVPTSRARMDNASSPISDTQISPLASDRERSTKVSSKASTAAPLSPAMQQYRQFKAQYPGYVLFFRMGDFYEMFWEDAKLAAKTLGVALTSRNKGAPDEIPMAGVPFH